MLWPVVKAAVYESVLRQDLCSACSSKEGALFQLWNSQAFWGCMWMLSPIFLQHELQIYFSSKTVPLHVMMMIIIFAVSYFTTFPPGDNVKGVSLWRRAVLQWGVLASPKWTACLRNPVQPSWALFLTELISWGITSCYSSYLASSSVCFI